MDSADRQVLDTALAWLAAGRRIALATVAQTWGSSPRPPGSWAVLREDGAVVGSVSGGCIEEELIHRVETGLLSENAPEIVTFGATQEEARRFGLPCGGTLQLVVEPNPDPELLQSLSRRLADGRIVLRILDMATGRVELEDTERTGKTNWDGHRLVTVHGPRLRLLIIGAVQISSYLASMAQALDYEVSVCDPRQEYLTSWAQTSVRLLGSMPDDAVEALKPDFGTAVVALTHDPKLDDLALIDALRSPAFYVGAIGSRPNADRRRARLSEHFGLTEAELDRLHTPAGLPIGSHTPPEIALSILAEMTAVRNAGAAAQSSLKKALAAA